MTLIEKLRWLWRAQSVVDAANDAAKEAGVDAKHILTSKTFYYALIVGVIGTLQQQGVFTLIPEPYGATVTALGILILRKLTTGPVNLLPKSA